MVAGSIMEEQCCDDLLKEEYQKEQALLKDIEANFKMSDCKVKLLLSYV